MAVVVLRELLLDLVHLILVSIFKSDRNVLAHLVKFECKGYSCRGSNSKQFRIPNKKI